MKCTQYGQLRGQTAFKNTKTILFFQNGAERAESMGFISGSEGGMPRVGLTLGRCDPARDGQPEPPALLCSGSQWGEAIDCRGCLFAVSTSARSEGVCDVDMLRWRAEVAC